MAILKVEDFGTAQRLRGDQINQGGGALILDASKPGTFKHMLEKLIKGQKYAGQPYHKINWKGRIHGTDEETGKPVAVWEVKPLVLVVGDESMPLLDEMEKLVPGFIEKFGPVEQHVE